MNISAYGKKRIFAFLFFFLALIPAWFENGLIWKNSTVFYSLYFFYATSSAILYPFSLALVENWKIGISDSIYWFNGVFIFCLIFAIPLGLVYIIKTNRG